MTTENKKTLRTAMADSKKNLVDVLEKNPDFINMDGFDINGNRVIRVSFDKRTDDALPMMMVLSQSNFLGEPTAEDIATLIQDRALDNKSITPNINMMMSDLSSGKTVLNADIMGATLEMENTAKVYREKVSNNPHIDWMMLSNYLVENIVDGLKDNKFSDSELKPIGYSVTDNLNQMKDLVISGAREVMLSNTDSEGNSPIHKSKHIADNLLSQSGSAKVINADQENAYLYGLIENSINDALESNGHERVFEFPSLTTFKKENPEVEKIIEKDNDVTLEDLSEMFGFDIEELTSTSNDVEKEPLKKRNKNRPS